MVPSIFMKFMVLMATVLYVESGTIPSHPDYLSVKNAKNNKLFTILEKSNMTNGGYPMWKTSDNKTMKIYVKAIELPGYKIKVNKWILDLNYNKHIITLEAPAPDPRHSPEMIDNWMTLHPTLNYMVPSNLFKIEQFEEKEYRDMFPESTQQTQKASTSHPDYIKFILAKDNRLLTILKKSNMPKNGYPEWSTPDNKTINIYMHSIEFPGYEIKMNKWMIYVNNSFRAHAPVPHPVLPPHLVSDWKKLGDDKKSWVSSALFRLEELEEKEYLEMFPESNQPTNKATTSHPEFLSIRNAKTNKLLAILKKSTINHNGYPAWKTPDNKTMQIYMRSTELLGYNIKQNKWIFDVVFKQAPIELQASVPDPILSPQSVMNWKFSDPRLNTLAPTAFFRVEQSSEMEYQAYIFQKIYKDDNLKDKSLPVQPRDLNAGPTFLQFKDMKNDRVVAIMKKSDTLKHGASMWQAPPDYLMPTTKINFEFMNQTPVWKLEMNIDNVQDVLLAHVTETTRYPHAVQWRSMVKPEEEWRENILVSIEELNEEEYNKLRAALNKLRAAEHQEQKPELQQGGLLENAKSLIFGKKSLFPRMAVGAILSESGIIGGVGGMGSDVFKEVGGIGSDVLAGFGQTTGELFSLPEKGIDNGLSMLGLETMDIGIGSHITALGTGVNSVSQGLGSGLSELTDGLGDGSTHFTNSLDNFFSGDITSSIGSLAAGSNSIVGAGFGSITSVGKGVFDGIENTADDFLGVIGLDNTDIGIDIGRDFLGTAGQGFGAGVPKIIEGFGDGSQQIIGGLEDGSQKIVNSIEHVFTGDFGQGIGDLSHGARNVLDGGVHGISSVGTNVFDGIGKTAGGLFDGSVGSVGDIFSSQNGISKVTDFGQNSAKKAVNTVTNTISKTFDFLG